ncbi:MAG: glycosyltransferase family 39 protein [Candidatus Omnitrophica bacterium]|nr:glycosyltransferase family 39 protein [Candidatus Omnitrophota bacterium]
MKRPLRLSAPGLGWGLLAGLWLTFSPGSLFLILLAAGIALGLWRGAAPHNKRFILWLFLAGFLVRAFLSIGLDGLACVVEREVPARLGPPDELNLNIVDHTRRYLQMGDSDYYSQRGYALSELTKGTIPMIRKYYREGYGNNFYLHLIALFYSVFGFSPVAVKLINGLLGALMGPVLFLVFRNLFPIPAARWAAGICAFFPSILLWSVTNLKEPLLILLTALLLLCFIQFQKGPGWKRRILYGSLFGAAFALHAHLRTGIYTAALAGSLVAAAFLTGRFRLPWKLLAVLLVLLGAVYGRAHLKPALTYALVVHVGHITTPGTVYRYLPDQFYSREAVQEGVRDGKIDGPLLLRGIVKALGHYLLEPLPRRVETLFTSLTYPQMVLWYFLLPPAFLGALLALRLYPRGGLPLVLLLSAWVFIGAVTGGNIGTLFRVRDMVSPYVILLACVGCWGLLEGRRDAAG